MDFLLFLGSSPSGVGQLTEVEVAERGSVGLAVYRHVANIFGIGVYANVVR